MPNLTYGKQNVHINIEKNLPLASGDLIQSKLKVARMAPPRFIRIQTY